MVRPQSPTACAALGPLAVGSLVWRFGGTTNLSVVMKATMAMMPGGPAAVGSPEPLLENDCFTLPGPVVSAPADLVPYVPRPELTLVGSAYLAEGATEAQVRVGLRRGEQRLMNKTLVVRSWDRDGRPAPAKSLRVDYTRALGGVGFADNPIGRGHDGDEKVNVIDPKSPGAVAGFAPLPRRFGARQRYVGDADLKALSGRDLSIPERFDWRFFQAAPEDQRFDALVGDELLELEGLDPGRRPWSTQLPGLSAAGRLYHAREAGLPADVYLRLETIHVDTEARRMQLVWRGSVPLPSSDAAGALVVAGCLTPIGQAVQWPTAAPTAQDEAEWLDDSLVFDAEGTLAMRSPSSLPAAASETVSLSSMPANKTLPFEKSSSAPPSRRVPSVVPGAPWATEPTRSVERPKANMTSTIDPVTGMQVKAGFEAYREATRKAQEEEAQRQEEAHRLAEIRREEVAERQAQERARELQAAKEAEARRRAAAADFAREQDEAEAAAQRREQEEALARLSSARALEQQLYGGFRKK